MSSNPAAATIKLMLYWQRKALKPSQRKKPRTVSMTYPLAVEKKYALMLRTWMKPLMDFTTDFIRQNGENLIRGDAAMELVIRCDALPGGTFTRLVDSLKGWLAIYVPEILSKWPDDGPAIWVGLGQAADDLNEANYRQWQKSSKSAMGVEFPKDEDWWPALKKLWQEQNYTLIKKLDTEYITQINNVTEQAVVNGWSVRQLVDEISKIETTMKKSRVNLIARDQIGKLNSMATQARMQSVGLNMYIWETAHDERVRGDPRGKYKKAIPSHYVMDGLLCRWDDPTVCSADGGKTWIARHTGAPLVHPGMDINCRCVATTYWEELMGEVDLKIAQENGEVYQVEEKKLKKKVIDLEIREGWSREFVEKVTEIMENNAVGVLDKELYEKLKEEYPDIDERLAKIKQFKDENKIVVSFDLSRKIDYFLEEPRYKTQFETGTSGGTLDKAKRNEWETIIAGKKTESWIEDKERPVYGVIADISTKSIPSARYGGSYFILKDEVRKRATYTIGNSSYEQGSFIDDPIAMLNKKNIPDRETGASFAVYFADGITKGSLEQHSYLETQIWGGIDLLKDVEMLVVPKENAFLPIANRDYDFISGNMKERYKKREPVTGKIVKEFTDKENSSNIKKWEAFVKMLEDSDVKVVIK